MVHENGKQENGDAGNDDGVSPRCLEMANKDEFMLAYLAKCGENPYSSGNNKEGYCNMGTASNSLCEDLIVERLNRPGTYSFTADMQGYFCTSGTPELRRSLADFLTKYFKTHEEIDPENLVVANGVTGCLDLCAFCFAEPGDVILTPTPAYTRIFYDCQERSGAQVVGVPLLSEGKETFRLTASAIEKAILNEHKNKRNVRAFVFVNPNNPLGEVYPLSLALEIMELCKKYEMHFISDEIYALSVFGDNTEFRSILSLPSVPDPQRTHCLWGVSKDFGLAGARVGVIHSLNTSALKATSVLGFYQNVSSCAQIIVAKMLSDRDWLDNIYLPTNRQRLRDSYQKTKLSLQSVGIPVRECQAGVFVMADFRKYMPHPATKETELDLFQRFFESKVYIIPGTQLLSTEPGWFRVIFAVKPEVLHEGLRRIKAVVLEQCKIPV